MPPRKAAEPVVDDWETEDYDAPVTAPTPAVQAAKNARLWNETSYTIIPSTSSATPGPPPVVTQPKLQILKRPSSAASANAGRGDSKTPPPKTLVERERAYQEARDRIFARDAANAAAKARETPTTRAPVAPPVDEADQRTAGFKRRDPTGKP